MTRQKLKDKKELSGEGTLFPAERIACAKARQGKKNRQFFRSDREGMLTDEAGK